MIAQTVVKGFVSDAVQNVPLQGVTIALRGQKIQTISANDGSYSISIPEGQLNGELIFTYVGYISQNILINNRTKIDVQLTSDGKELDNVVVVSGYGKTKRKEELVGSIATINSKELMVDRPIESFDKMMEGLVAGVQVQTNTELGAPVKINIRGQNSLSEIFGSNRQGLTTSSQPLYVIDGVPITEQRKGDEPIAFGAEQFINPLSGINPDDIESISVLKDAAAASVYGANASNGVIIITTKKGRSGKTRFGFSMNAGISNPINRIQWLNGQQYHELAKELFLSEGIDPANAERLAGSNEISTDWFGLTNRSGSFQNYDVEMSGGSQNSTFRVSASFMNNQSIQLGNDFQKAYFRVRLDNKLSNKFSLSTSLAPSITRRNSLTVYNELTPIVPNIPAYNADSTFYQIVGVPNPLAVLEQNENYSEGGSMNGNFRIDYQALPDLRISGNIGSDIQINKQNVFQSPLNETGRTQGGFLQILDRQVFSWIGFAQANYTPKIGEDHKLDILVGYEMQSKQTKLLRGSGTGFSYSGLRELSNASQQSSASSRQVENAYSFYGQVGYHFKEKYYANVSGRQDAASIFGTDVNTTLNGAFGLGWNAHKEKFLEGAKWIDLLRIRMSYGTTGNSRIGSYEARGLYVFSNSGYNRLVGSNPATLPNPDLSWEKQYITNIGINFDLFSRFKLTFDMYNKILDDAISVVEVPFETGFRDILANTAKMRNWGFDGSIQAAIIRTKKFNWTSTLNYGYNKNEVLEVKAGGQRFGTSENAVALRPGVSTTTIWGFRQAGVDPQTGIEQFFDRDGKILSTDDRTPGIFDINQAYAIGDRLPDLVGGFINNFSFYGITINVLLTYEWGADRLVNYRNEWNGNNLDNRNQSVNMMDRWKEPGDITSIPRLSRIARSGIRFVPNSSRYVYDETHIKLANLGISYRLPSKWAKAIKADNVLVFANGTNLFYWYKDDAPDGRNGIRQYRFSFPEAQTFTGGVRVNW
ncbi:MAG: SusC/RagA family TonB-linked outer membrane protein [Chitinophagaceae bacterium]|nr:SusC/RagA family TonB-linked outer membrane protein [Chitinophagaceae bacterium]